MRGCVFLVVLVVAMSAVSVSAWGPCDPSDRNADPDGDKLGNIDEFRAGTDPLNPDTDGGGCPDGWEVRHGLDPKDRVDDWQDTDSDGWSNRTEYVMGTDPTDPNTDDDMYPLDSTDPHPLLPDDGWYRSPGGIGATTGNDDQSGPVPVPWDPSRWEDGNAMGQGQTPGQSPSPGEASGEGNGMGQGQGQGEGNGKGQGQGQGQRFIPPFVDPDADVDGLVEFIDGL
jgi:hypothetical protein